jgi:hypothetical protein
MFKKLLTPAMMLSSTMAADAITDARVAKVIESIDVPEIENKIRADIIKWIEEKAIADEIEREVQEKVTELQSSEDTVW